MTTREAFEQLVNERGFYKRIEGLTESNGRQLRSNFKEGKVSIDKMEELLTKAGYSVAQEKIWGNEYTSPVKRYMLFAWAEKERSGGMNDFVDDYDDLQDAYLELLNNWYFGHVFDTWTKETLLPDQYAEE